MAEEKKRKEKTHCKMQSVGREQKNLFSFPLKAEDSFRWTRVCERKGR